MAIIFSPLALALEIISRGVISSEPQGERREWIWRSALIVFIVS
jgi:hypothetical protein